MSEDQPNTFSLNIEEISNELRVRPEIYRRLLHSFSKTIIEKMQVLEEALKTDDVMKMRAILHEVKGTSGNLRLKAMSETANTLHVAVKAGEPKEKLEEYFVSLKARTKEFVEFAQKMEQGN